MEQQSAARQQMDNARQDNDGRRPEEQHRASRQARWIAKARKLQQQYQRNV